MSCVHCIAHGGGPRCAVPGAHLVEIEKKGYAPYAEHVLSENCALNGFPQPELIGTRCCMGCLKRYDPTHEAVRVLVHKEHLVVAGIVEELHARGRGDLVDRLVHDCAAGPSRRRADLALRFRDRDAARKLAWVIITDPVTSTTLYNAVGAVVISAAFVFLPGFLDALV